jgi:hypothetical protein
MSPLLRTFGNSSVRGWSYSLGDSAWISRVNSNEGTYRINTRSISATSEFVYTAFTFDANSQQHQNTIGVINNKTGVVSTVRQINTTAGDTIRVSANNSRLSFGAPFRIGAATAGTLNALSGRVFSSRGNTVHVAIASDNSVYATGQGNNQGTPIVKFNNNSTISWFREVGPWSTGGGNSISVDGSDSVLVTATNQGSSSAVVKRDASGAFQWSQQFFLGSTANEKSLVAADSANDVFYAQSSGSSQEDTYIAKFNSSGTLQWSKTIPLSGICGVSADNLGNSYYLIRNNSTSAGTVVKFSSSGTVLWQRQITTSLGSISYFLNVLDCDATSFYFGGNINFVNGFVAKLPNDGSKTGTYSIGGETWTIAAGNLTVNNGGISENKNQNNAGTPANPDISNQVWDLSVNSTRFSQGPVRIL